MDEFEINIREMTSDDAGLVYDTWLKSMWMQCLKDREIADLPYLDKPMFLKEQRDRIKRCLMSPTSLRLVASLPGYEYQVPGYVVAEAQSRRGFVLHFVYVRRAFRNLRIATRLIKNAYPALGEHELIYSQHTSVMKHYLDKWRAKYNPFAIGG